jgi:hypothetical protein
MQTDMSGLPNNLSYFTKQVADSHCVVETRSRRRVTCKLPHSCADERQL